MTVYRFYKTKPGTPYSEGVKKHFEQLKLWPEVFTRLSELMGEQITKMAFVTRTLVLDRKELKKEENQKLFKLDGEIKSNTKKAKNLLADYQAILADVGLSDFQELRDLDFTYGVMRRSRGQDMDRFKTSEQEIYYRTDFDLIQVSGGMVEEITEKEYAQKYLEEVSKKEQEGS